MTICPPTDRLCDISTQTKHSLSKPSNVTIYYCDILIQSGQIVHPPKYQGSDLENLDGSALCQTWWRCTSEDECKCFIAIWFILLKQKANMTLRLQYTVSWNINKIYTQGVEHSQYITHSVHDGSSLSRLTLLPILLVASWGCCPPLLAVNCLSCSPLGGPGPPPHFPYLGCPHFPWAPGTFQPLCRIQSQCNILTHCYNLSQNLWHFFNPVFFLSNFGQPMAVTNCILISWTCNLNKFQAFKKRMTSRQNPLPIADVMLLLGMFTTF
jgi:hypothetical protein